MRPALLLRALPALALACLATGASAAPPVVTKVEPPSWWPGHSLDPVRVMVRGRGLEGARLEPSAGSGLSVSRTSVGPEGTTLFADLRIEPGATPGPRDLAVTTPRGRTTARFALLPPLPREGRFQGFSPDDVIYLIMPDRFANGDRANDDPARSRGLLDRSKGRYYHGGDLAGIKARLPYLKDLGVTALWLNPIYDNHDRLNERETYDGQPVTDYHGYGAVDFYAVDEHLGDLATLRDLVDAAHAAGIKVIQDQVANHSGPYHPWVTDPPTPTWFNGTAAKHLANTWQTWTLADPHAAPQLQRATLDGWFIDILPDLNQDDPETAAYIVQNSLWWVGMTGFDGIRQDTLPYVPRTFWRDWMAALKREYPSLRVVGELFDGNPALVSFFQGGRARYDGIDTGIDTLFDFPLFFALRRAFAEGKPLREVAMTLAHDHLYARPHELVTFLGLHDVARFMNEPGATLDGLRLAFTLLMTTRGTPLVYYGDEIGLPGGPDPDNRRDFPGGWPGDARDAFTAAGRAPGEEAVFQHVRRLTRLRSRHEALRRGALVHLLAEEQFYAFARTGAGGPVVVVMNNSPVAAEAEFETAPAGLGDGAVLEDRLGTLPGAEVRGGRLRVSLPARSAGVLVRVR
ncbi:MAG TPA: alpha-amylase family glycosyl hydrolase [Vicinamibacteria bacterium]|nr:alpha-amylase family glycosyl hydrolase [Vicinamibacteria bacterium]